MQVSSNTGSLVFTPEASDASWVQEIMDGTSRPNNISAHQLVRQLVEKAAWSTTATYQVASLAGTITDGTTSWWLPSMPNYVARGLGEGEFVMKPVRASDF